MNNPSTSTAERNGRAEALPVPNTAIQSIVAQPPTSREVMKEISEINMCDGSINPDVWANIASILHEKSSYIHYKKRLKDAAECRGSQSPIELMLILAISEMIETHYSSLPGCFINMLLDEHDLEQLGCFTIITQQENVGKYLADIFIKVRTRKGDISIAVECDGHDFHERTKEQAARDKKRDRFFQLEGINVLRFTGSEIWNDPYGCADEVCKHLENRFYKEIHPVLNFTPGWSRQYD